MTHILEDILLKLLARVLLRLLGLLWDGLRLRLGGDVRAQVLAQVGLPPVPIRHARSPHQLAPPDWPAVCSQGL